MAKAKAKAAKKKSKKPEQLRIAGTERIDGNPQIDKAAKAYVEARDSRMEMTEDEVETQAALDEVMLKAGLEEYIYCDARDVKHRVKVSAQRKVSVRKIRDEPKAKAA